MGDESDDEGNTYYYNVSRYSILMFDGPIINIGGNDWKKISDNFYIYKGHNHYYTDIAPNKNLQLHKYILENGGKDIYTLEFNSDRKLDNPLTLSVYKNDEKLYILLDGILQKNKNNYTYSNLDDNDDFYYEIQNLTDFKIYKKRHKHYFHARDFLYIVKTMLNEKRKLNVNYIYGSKYNKEDKYIFIDDKEYYTTIKKKLIYLIKKPAKLIEDIYLHYTNHKKLMEEIIYLPEFHNFSGGLEYQKAKQRFESRNYPIQIENNDKLFDICQSMNEDDLYLARWMIKYYDKLIDCKRIHFLNILDEHDISDIKRKVRHKYNIGEADKLREYALHLICNKLTNNEKDNIKHALDKPLANPRKWFKDNIKRLITQESTKDKILEILNKKEINDFLKKYKPNDLNEKIFTYAFNLYIYLNDSEKKYIRQLQKNESNCYIQIKNMP
jgi:hypothetical protein